MVDIELKSGRHESARAWALEAQKIRCMSSGAGEGDTLVKSFRDEAARLHPESVEHEALSLVRALAGGAEATAPSAHPRRARFLANLARASSRLGDADGAAKLLDMARAVPDPPNDDGHRALIEAVERETASPR